MASGPWDNVQLAGPPNGPAWIQAAAQMMGTTQGAINNAANQYQNWQNFNYQQNQRNFFQDPNNQQLLSQFLQQPTQQNYAALMQPMIQAGGMQAAGPMIDQYLGITQDANLANRIGGGGGQPPPTTGPATNSSASGPENIHGNFSSPQPRIGYGTGDQPNINTVAGKIGANLPDEVAQRIARSVGVSSPEDDLTPDQARVAQQRISAYTNRTGSANRNPVSQSGNGDQEAAAGQLTPSGIGGSSQQSPRQTGERRTAQAATFSDRFGASGDRSGERPTPLGDMAKVDAMNARIQQLRADAARYARRSPAAAQQADKAADDMVKERDKILESIGKYNEPGRIQKDVESGAIRASEIIKGNVEQGRKDLTAIDKTGNDYRISNQKVQLAKSLLMSPDFYSGPLEDVNRQFKAWTATLGGDPNKGTPQQAFNKTVSDLLSEQIRTMASSGVGRVLLSEVQQMQKGIASLGVTPSSNRLLLEEVDRVQKAHIAIQDMAHEYLKTHDYLDPNFERLTSQYFTRHPLFSERELRNPMTIAPARMPQNITQDPVKIREWARQNGLKPGDPFAGQDGSGPYKLPAI